MQPSVINSPEAALLAGLVTSLHCAAMCGPLACAVVPARGGDATVAQTTYHSSRVLSYTLIGVVGGTLGALPFAWLGPTATLLLPWALVLFFVVAAFRVEAWLPKATWAGRLYFRAMQRVRGLPRPLAAAGFGFFTPLLPCGPLYLVISLALFTGGPVRGAEFMLAFGLGTVPLLWLAQNRYAWLQEKLPGPWLARVRAGVALACALVLAWRLRAAFGLEGPSIESFVCP